MQSIINM